MSGADDSGASKAEHTVVLHVTPGETFDERWLIESRVGQGAMGSVFQGRDLKLSKKVAIKILSPEHCRKPKVLARFEREARLMTNLRHPNIVQLHGVGRRGALPYIVMQYLEGVTLAEHLKRKGGKLSPVETLGVVRQVCSGLSFIHHHGLVHRDIKPQNIFIGDDGHTTILDLGVVRDKSEPGLTKPGAMVGTPYYMAPEQILGTSELDRRADVYALGAVIFELLTGTPPFVAPSNFEVLYAHRTLPPPDASVLSAFVPKPVALVINRALAKQPEERQQNVHELLADLEVAYGLDRERTSPGTAFSFEEAESAPRRKKARGKPARKPTQPEAPALKEISSDDEPTGSVAQEKVEEKLEEASFADSADVELIDSGAADTGDDSPTQAETVSADETDIREKRLSASGTREDSARTDPAAPAGRGELRVVTTVKGLTTGAQVTIDREKKGTAPVSVALPVGRHSVRIERTGYKPVDREVEVKTKRVTLLRVELESRG
ncbi:MAG: serine/threonine protein kinase [Myxococcales bacterium]|nr:serine/threonine protein kinase [Myxococcales bacterium]